jgi:opacity protein-like surface antigen
VPVIRRWYRFAAAALAIAAAPLSAGAQWSPDFEATLLYNDNLSGGQRTSDIVEDYAAVGRASLGRSFALGERSDFVVAVEGKLVRYARFDRASFISLGASGGYRRKLGLGLTAPRLLADVWFAYEDAVERVRDARRYGASLALSKRFDDRFVGSLGAAYDARRQSARDQAIVPGISGEAFSLQGRTLSARASYAAGERVTLLAGAAVRHGDVEASTRRNFQIFAESSAIANDPAIGPDFVAYRISGARTRSLSLGLSWELDRRSSLDFHFSGDYSRARAGIEYDARLFSVSYMYRP